MEAAMAIFHRPSFHLRPLPPSAGQPACIEAPVLAGGCSGAPPGDAVGAAGFRTRFSTAAGDELGVTKPAGMTDQALDLRMFSGGGSAHGRC